MCMSCVYIIMCKLYTVLYVCVVYMCIISNGMSECVSVRCMY